MTDEPECRLSYNTVSETEYALRQYQYSLSDRIEWLKDSGEDFSHLVTKLSRITELENAMRDSRVAALRGGTK